MSENREPEHEPYRRPDDLIGTLLGGTTEGLSEEERIMQKLLIEEYAKQDKEFIGRGSAVAGNSSGRHVR